MDAQTYRTALATLGLTQKAAGEWLGVSEKTAKRYATTGPSGPAARAIEMRLALWSSRERIALAIQTHDNDHIPDGYADGWNDSVSDWSAYLADCVVAELT